MSHAYLVIAVLLIVACRGLDAVNINPYDLVIRGPISLKLNIDGGWSRWGAWRKCSKTCEGGLQIRTRTCTNPKPNYFGAPCSGSTTGRRRCPCTRVNGGWTVWSRWNACSVTCGGGFQARTRTCTRPRPSCCGATCPYSGISGYGVGGRSTRVCNTESCIVLMAKKFSQAVMFQKFTSKRKVSRITGADHDKVWRYACIYGDRDFLIILDSSGSIGKDNYTLVKMDLAVITASLCGNLGDDLQVAAMQFSTTTRKEYAFDDYNDVIELFDATMAMNWLKGWTRTYAGFDFARQTMFTAVNGYRANALKQALIVTDGKSNGVPDAESRSIAAAKALKHAGVEVFALWIGSPTPRVLNEIRAYASNPKEKHVFHVDSVASLQYFVANVMMLHGNICC